MTDDKQLIEDYLPIVAISAEASREKSVRKGHISTLHLWWARRPLVACRAAVYGALVPASRFVPNGGSDAKKKSLGRANSSRFVKDLCRYPAGPRAVEEAQRHILIAHADRLTQEITDWKTGNLAKPGWIDEFKFSGANVTVEDVTAGRAPRPRVLDMFAGGGAIPLEALRLGCEAFALDLNPVAHIIQLCTLVYPQKYGKPDTTARGMTGSKNANGEITWGGLAKEIGYWGNWILQKVKAEAGYLYPLIPDPQHKVRMKHAIQLDWFKEHDSEEIPTGYLIPVAYLWTRTVKCKKPSCRATVPLVKQTWLCKKNGRFVALKMIAPRGKKEVRFEVVEATSEKRLGFDPTAFSKGGNAVCLFCGTVADTAHVKAEGCAGRMGKQLMACVVKDADKQTRYLSADEAPECVPDASVLTSAIRSLEKKFPQGLLDEEMNTSDPTTVAGRGFGISRWRDIYFPRQLLFLGHCADSINAAQSQMRQDGISSAHSGALLTYLAVALDRLANYHTSFNVWRSSRTCVLPLFTRQAIPMVWDSGEMNAFSGSAGDWAESIEYVAAVINDLATLHACAAVTRGSAVSLPYKEQMFDAVISDPPYYDNVSYAVLSDFFYVWLKRVLAPIYPEHFASKLTPKQGEAIADSVRHGGPRAAHKMYESLMNQAFGQAWARLKPGGPLVLVYAHKTTSGWSTLVNALRSTGFEVLEAWPLDTEMTGGMRAGTASLASSIFLVARKRDPASKVANYESNVVPELGNIVRERVDTLWEMGISGADLVIACVGAGLRAFTRYTRVEFGNGEEVPAERFLAEVETVVLETILGKLSKTVGSKNGQTTLAGLDPATRFYVLWRYTYGAAELDAGEAIIFANGTHVELDGQHSLTEGKRALLEKTKGNYQLHDYTERGDENSLGQPTDGTSAPTIDILHRLLWLMEHKPLKVPDFIGEVKPNVEQIRLVAQALVGPALSGGELSDVSSTAEQSALGKLLANWNTVMVGKAAVEDRRTGQQSLFKN